MMFNTDGMVEPNLRSALDEINAILNIMYADLGPQLTIYHDGSWSLAIDGWSAELGKHRIEGEASGNDVHSLIQFCEGKEN